MIIVNENGIKDILNNGIEKEIVELQTKLDNQQDLTKRIVLCLNSVSDAQNSTLEDKGIDNVHSTIHSSLDILKKCNDNIDSINELLQKLLEMKLNSKIMDLDLLEEFKKFNEDETKCFENVCSRNIDINKFLEENIDSLNLLDEQIEDSSNLVEDTLIISYQKGTVTLPYRVSEIATLYEEHKNYYKSLQDVVFKLYTRPIKFYKYPTVSRFKEAFKLVKERSNGSIKEAIDLGLEVFTNSKIHPAIISACKNTNEFDVYLSCLEYNELNDFHFFKIVFESAPIVNKNKHFFKENDGLIYN